MAIVLMLLGGGRLSCSMLACMCDQGLQACVNRHAAAGAVVLACELTHPECSWSSFGHRACALLHGIDHVLHFPAPLWQRALCAHTYARDEQEAELACQDLGTCICPMFL